MTSDRRWADPLQALAVRAAVAEPEAEALAAWRELVSRADLPALWDGELYRMLPLVWRRFGAEVGDDHHGLLKGLYRRAWAQNQHHLRAGATAVEALTGAGIDALVLKGMALTVAYYQDTGARPMGDVDLMVEPDRFEAAGKVLEGLGYERIPMRPADASPWEREGDPAWDRRLRHAVGYRRGPLESIDVHWTLSLDFVTTDPADADMSALWADARPLEVEGTAARTLSPTGHLFHAVTHGLGAAEEANLRWVVDALTVLRASGDEIDWDELPRLAARHRCTLLLAEGLEHLATEWQAPIPAAVQARLGAAPVDARQKALRWIRRGRGQRVLRSGHAAGLFLTSTAPLGPVRSVSRAPAFLVDYWQLAGLRHLPLVLAHKLRHRKVPQRP